MEQRECSISKKINLEKTEWCSKTSLNLFEEDLAPLIAKIKLSNSLQNSNVSKMGIYFTLGESGLYCDYCYDGVKNYDEENVDCGGPNCQSCLVPKKFFNWVLLIIILLWVLVAFLIIVNLRNFRDELHFLFLKNSSYENKIERALFRALDFRRRN
ncbi:hypothetical protein J4474_02080 [Candidatus Pacearchaeota archaeon]|nr:hypothetical protein [Candidatus Pacearchaeota archaeon]